MPKSLLLAAASAAAVIAAPANASLLTYQANLTELNGSGASGTATAVYDTAAQSLELFVSASGLVPDRVHPQHIHGNFSATGCTDTIPSGPLAGACIDSSTNLDSITPTLADDIDGDGFIETLEGAQSYGPIILNAGTGLDAGGNPIFPSADASGNLNFNFTYDLATTDLLFDPLFMVDHEPEDLLPLDLREFVIHGVFVEGGGGGMFEVTADTMNEYVQLLPALSGAFEFVSEVPEPATLGLFGLGLMGLAGARIRRRRLA